MIKEDKQLLLTDLSGRLPYGVKIRIIHHEIKGADPEYVDDVFSTTHYNMIDYDDDNYEFLPYLRPMSSMTEEESNELESITFPLMEKDWDGNENPACIRWIDIPKYMDFILSHHFDYQGLIEKGLAIEATEGMYGKEEQQ